MSELLDFLCYVIFYDFVSVKIKLVHIRELFVHILTNNSVADPSKLWEQNWKPVSDDILYKRRLDWNNLTLQLSEMDIYNYTLAGMFN